MHLTDMFLLPWWVSLPLRRLVAEWLVASGHPGLGGYSSVIWLHLPTWCAALILGGLIGGLGGRKRWLTNALTCGIGFVAAPHLLILLTLEGYHPFVEFPTRIVLLTLLWDLVSMPLLLASGWLFSQLRRQEPTTSRPSPSSAA